MFSFPAHVNIASLTVDTLHVASYLYFSSVSQSQLRFSALKRCIPSIPLGLSYGSVSKPCTPVVHIKIAGKWMFIPLKMVLIGIDPYPYVFS